MLNRIAAITGLALGGFALSVLASTWSAPTQSPPNGNVAAPINVGSTEQTRFGILNIGNSASPTGNILLRVFGTGVINSLSSANITTTNEMATNLTTTNLKVTGGAVAAGNVLVSDASGNAVWKSISCPGTQVLRGISSTGSPICVSISTGTGGTSGTGGTGGTVGTARGTVGGGCSGSPATNLIGQHTGGYNLTTWGVGTIIVGFNREGYGNSCGCSGGYNLAEVSISAISTWQCIYP